MLRTRRVADRIYALSGEIDVSNAEELLRALSKDLELPGNLTLDLDELTYVDTAGIRTFLTMATRLDVEGRLVLEHPSRGLLRLWELTGLPKAGNLEMPSEGGVAPYPRRPLG